MAGTGIGTFNDRLRDGVRGGGPFSGLQEQGFLTGLLYDPNATNQGSPDQQRTRLLQDMDWIRVGLAGNLADYAFVDRFGNTVHGAGHRLQRPARRLHRRPAGGHQLRRGPRQRDAVRRDPAQGAGGHGHGRPRAHAEPGHEPARASARASRSSTPASSCCARSRSTATATTPATGSTGSTSPTSRNNWGVGLPPAADNQANWPVMRPLLANPALQAAPTTSSDAFAHFREMLAIRAARRCSGCARRTR